MFASICCISFCWGLRNTKKLDELIGGRLSAGCCVLLYKAPTEPSALNIIGISFASNMLRNTLNVDRCDFFFSLTDLAEEMSGHVYKS